MYSIYSVHLPAFKCLTVLNNVVITINSVLKYEKTNSCVLHWYLFKCGEQPSTMDTELAYPS